jgi:hypothetical protein
MGICRKLAEANVSYRIALGGDEVVDHPVAAAELRGPAPVLVVEPRDFLAADRKLLEAVEPARSFDSLDKALEHMAKAVTLPGNGSVRVFPRVKPGSAVIHLLNWDYAVDADQARPARDVRLRLDLKSLGVPNAKEGTLFAPGAKDSPLRIEANEIVVPELGLWAVLRL